MMNTGTVAALGWRGRSWAYTGQPGTRERWNQVTSGPITRGWCMVEVVTVSLLILQKTFSVKSHDIQLAFSFTHCLLLDHQAVALTMHNQHLFDGSSCSMWCIFGLYYILHITTTTILRTETRRGWLTSKTIELIYIFYWSLRGPSCCFFMILISISRCLLPWSEHPLSFLCLTILLKLEPASLSLRRGFSK